MERTQFTPGVQRAAVRISHNERLIYAAASPEHKEIAFLPITELASIIEEETGVAELLAVLELALTPGSSD